MGNYSNFSFFSFAGNLNSMFYVMLLSYFRIYYWLNLLLGMKAIGGGELPQGMYSTRPITMKKKPAQIMTLFSAKLQKKRKLIVV